VHVARPSLFPSFRTRVHAYVRACMHACVRVRPLPPSRYKHRTHASLLVHGGAATRSLSHPLSSPVRLSHSLAPPHFRATRSVLLSPQPPHAFLFSLSLSLSLFLGYVFTLSHLPRRPPFPHSRHPIPDTRYLIMLNASGFCGRIMRPHCPRTLFRSLCAAFSSSLSLLHVCCSTVALISRSLMYIEKGFVTVYK